MMLIGRSIQGIGGGGIMTLGEILVTDMVPLSVRGGKHYQVSLSKHILTSFSMVWLSWCNVGDWKCVWTTHRRSLCTKRFMVRNTSPALIYQKI